MKKIRINVGNKLPLYILMICAVSFALLGLISYIVVGNILTKQCKTDAMEFARFAAGEIDGDKFAALTSPEDEDYEPMYNILYKYSETELVTYIYAMRMDDGVVRFIIDADTIAPADFGEEYELLDDMVSAFSGKVTCDSQLTRDEWGSYYSAYAPIKCADGTVSGIVGCDIEYGHVEKVKENLRNVIIILISLIFILYFMLYSRLSRNMLNNDLLTELPNYDGLIEMGEKLKKRKKLCDYTAVLVNIKDFKYLNQKNGVNSGDAVLKEFAGFLRKNISRKEFAARTGSDNFFVLIFKDHEEQFLERLKDVRLYPDVNGSTELMNISLRCGIYLIGENDSIKEIMNSASMALKESRLPAASDFVRYQAIMADSMVEEKKILNDYKRALKDGEFTVFYQPKVNIENYELCGAEALVRWIKDGRIIPPNCFIPILEKENRITELDFYVFDMVCQNLCEWKKKGIKPCRVSSNFSKIHLANPNFANDIISIVKKYDVDPSYLEIELTESSGYSDFDALTRFVNAMNDASINTSIDDFGTGYSSLSLLKDINVDVVKIDKSFLDKSRTDDLHQEKMLENIIKMINDLDRTVICEGVENEEQLMFLKKADCSIIQGYLFDKPLPHDEFEKRLLSPSYK